MKRLFCAALCFVLLLSLGACSRSAKAIEPEREYAAGELARPYVSKDSVEELYPLIGEMLQENAKLRMQDPNVTTPDTLQETVEYLKDYRDLYEENCYNVTPPIVAKYTKHTILKFNGSCESYIVINGKAYSLCTSLGGYGFVNAVPWDYNEDGNLDLLVASSWGSGIHRSELTVFDTRKKESVPVADLRIKYSTTPEMIREDLMVAVVPADGGVRYAVYSFEPKRSEDGLVFMSCVVKEEIGQVIMKDGMPVLVAAE